MFLKYLKKYISQIFEKVYIPQIFEKVYIPHILRNHTWIIK